MQRLAEGALSRREERRMGLPWSGRLVRRSRLAVQGTLNAALMALQDGAAANLASGTHHAFPAHGEGFCVLLLSGGYAPTPEATADLHAIQHREARRVFG